MKDLTKMAQPVATFPLPLAVVTWPTPPFFSLLFSILHHFKYSVLKQIPCLIFKKHVKSLSANKT